MPLDQSCETALTLAKTRPMPLWWTWFSTQRRKALSLFFRGGLGQQKKPELVAPARELVKGG